ncbi:hypothetical protein HYT53_05720 [Candidatus Woesearchaeota archaeon]|nr:hypothetical protein [Candidatus Woesearchaeota archaeon]
MKGKKKKKTINRAVKKSSGRTILQIVKRKGHTELYDERKVYGSCFFACRNAHLSVQESEGICNKVTASVTKWVKTHKIVSSSDIFRALIQELKKHNEDAAFLYETHRDIS